MKSKHKLTLRTFLHWKSGQIGREAPFVNKVAPRGCIQGIRLGVNNNCFLPMFFVYVCLLLYAQSLQKESENRLALDYFGTPKVSAP